MAFEEGDIKVAGINDTKHMIMAVRRRAAPVLATHEPGLGAAPEGGDIRVVEDLDRLACFGPDGHGEEHLPLQLPPLPACLGLCIITLLEYRVQTLKAQP